MSEPNERDHSRAGYIESGLYQQLYPNGYQDGRATYVQSAVYALLEKHIAAYREEIEAQRDEFWKAEIPRRTAESIDTDLPAPAQAREEDALVQIARVEQAHCYTENGTPDWIALQDDLRKIGDIARAALRSRQSPQAVDEAPWLITRPDQNGEYGVWAGKTHCIAEGMTLKKAQELLATHASAPQPSPQAEERIKP